MQPLSNPVRMFQLIKAQEKVLWESKIQHELKYQETLAALQKKNPNTPVAVLKNIIKTEKLI